MKCGTLCRDRPRNLGNSERAVVREVISGFTSGPRADGVWRGHEERPASPTRVAVNVRREPYLQEKRPVSEGGPYREAGRCATFSFQQFLLFEFLRPGA